MKLWLLLVSKDIREVLTANAWTVARNLGKVSRSTIPANAWTDEIVASHQATHNSTANAWTDMKYGVSVYPKIYGKFSPPMPGQSRETSAYNKKIKQDEIDGVNYYFKEAEAHEWKLKHLNHRLEKENVLLTWTAVYKDWQDSLENIKKNNYKNVPGCICSHCNDLLNVDTFEAMSILNSFKEWYIKLYERSFELKFSERVQKQETNIFSSQKVTELFQRVTDVLGKRNESDFEEERVSKKKYNRDEGLEIDPELVIQEVNEVMIPYSERSLIIILGKARGLEDCSDRLKLEDFESNLNDSILFVVQKCLRRCVATSKRRLVIEINDVRIVTIDLEVTELKAHRSFIGDPVSHLMRCYGITQDPKKPDTYTLWFKSNPRQKNDHQYLHSRNILIDDTEFNSPAISDLAFCNTPNESGYGVWQYVAPERINNKQHTETSDIYSFGIIMCETMSYEKPFNKFEDNSDIRKAIYVIRNDLKPEYPKWTPKSYVELILRCLDKDPSKRPSASKLCSNFNDFIESYYNNENNENNEFVVAENQRKENLMKNKLQEEDKKLKEPELNGNDTFINTSSSFNVETEYLDSQRYVKINDFTFEIATAISRLEINN
ncbi:hypothetical protein Glove_126g22 [Diversispora epigaea]|uniref:Protein kinase domain-containing protein n=1 Tax=Diversispora epigaea TaxID=1348612 RepID=A0A397J8D5_9GLOM|nr:hypothetical protein Glove_126g22 [Diversispora epigaea]